MTATVIPLRPAPLRPLPSQPLPPPQPPSPRGRPSRRPLWLVAGIFLLPLTLGWGLFFLGWQPTGQPHGTLFQPPRPLPAYLATESSHGHWQVLLVGQGPCANDCQAARRSLAQLRATLGKYADRVSLGEVAAPPLAIPAISKASAIASGGGIPAKAVAAPTKPIPTTTPPSAYRFYLADPAGRLILAYPAEVPWNDLRQDLERLLKYSWVG